MPSVLCFYHAPCNDGAASAAALNKRISEQSDGDEIRVEFHPMTFTVNWDDPLSQGYMDRLAMGDEEVAEIFIVDISLSPTKYRQILSQLRDLGRVGSATPRTVCIDHHRSALDNREILEEYCDDLFVEIGPGLSGATLVWKYFDRRLGEEKPMPDLLRYVADQDVWEWKLPESKSINSALNTLDGLAETMVEELERSLENPEEWFTRRRDQGRAILSVIDSQVQKSYSRVRDIVAENGVEYRIVNATENSSELGNELCQESDHTPNAVAIIFSLTDEQSVKCSIRSIDGGKVNARSVAEQFGGGGHDHASGCRFASYAEFADAMKGLTGEKL